MRTVAGSRTVVIVGAHPRATAAEVLGELGQGGNAALYVLGLEPSRAQRRIAEEALSLAAERRFELTAELIPRSSLLRERLRDDDHIVVRAGRRERRRLSLADRDH